MSKKTSSTPQTAASPFKELFDRIECDTGVIFVDTPEETRLIREVYREYNNQSVQFWSIRFGLHRIVEDVTPSADDFMPYSYNPGNARNTKDGKMKSPNSILDCCSIIEEDCREKIDPERPPSYKSVYILRDADKYFNNPAVVRAFRDLVYMASSAASTIIVTGFGITVPNDLIKDAAFLKISYPTRQDIIDNILPAVKDNITEHNKKNTRKEFQIDPTFDEEEVARSCAGLTEDEIINVLQYTTTVDNRVCIDRILEQKRSIINKSDILDYWICDTQLADVGGFGALKSWFQVRKVVMTSPHAKAFKAKYPKGILLLGVQGSGKTYIAKSVAADLGMSLIKLEMGKVFAGLVGESEKRMRQALAQIEAAGGIVLVDELDKGLSGAGSSDKTDGGTTSRVIGTLLTWLQEDHPGVFLIATANDISKLLDNHPELLRKGRFDELWFSDLPTMDERKDIFRIHLLKNNRDPKKFDLDLLAAITYIDDETGREHGYTGAEIQYATEDAIQEAFALGGGRELEISGPQDVTTELIAEKLRLIKPMAGIAYDPINRMRKWASKNARNVSLLAPVVGETKKPTVERGPRMSLRSGTRKIEKVECDL